MYIILIQDLLGGDRLFLSVLLQFKYNCHLFFGSKAS